MKKKKTKRSTLGREMSSTKEEQERLRVAALENSPPLPLWRLFREALLNGGACRDIVEKHVMCKLNGTDLKFLYEVNTETRKLIKRSSRKGELKEMFKVKEMSSISTLEFAWELYPWGKLVKYEDERMDGSWFCSQVASSCSSGRERRKSVDGMERRLMRLQTKVIWKL